MAKNKNKKSKCKKDTVTIKKLDYEFTLAQNEHLKKKNRELQTLLKGKSRNIIRIIDSLGKIILDSYTETKKSNKKRNNA